MKAQEKQQFAEVLFGTAQVYDREVKPAMVEIYWSSLKQFSLQQIRQAFTQHLRDPEHGQFMPRPADIIRHIEGDPEDRGLKAWSKFVKAAERHGGSKTVIFDDPIIHAVIHDMGGWIQMSSWEEKDEPFIERKFVKRYKAYAVSGEIIRIPRLAGSVELDNAAGQVGDPRYDTGVAPPLLIGDRSAARRVAGRIEEQKRLDAGERKVLKQLQEEIKH